MLSICASDLEPGTASDFQVELSALLESGEVSTDHLITFLSNKSLDASVTVEALKIIADVDKHSIKIIGALCGSPVSDIRLTCIRLLARQGGKDAVAYINQTLSRERNEVIVSFVVRKIDNPARWDKSEALVEQDDLSPDILAHDLRFFRSRRCV